MRRILLLSLLVLAAFPAAASAGVDVAWAERQVGIREVGTSNCSSRIDGWVRAMGLRVPPCRPWCGAFVHQAALRGGSRLDRKSTRLNSSHANISYAVFCLKKKKLTKLVTDVKT